MCILHPGRDLAMSRSDWVQLCRQSRPETLAIFQPLTSQQGIYPTYGRVCRQKVRRELLSFLPSTSQKSFVRPLSRLSVCSVAFSFKLGISMTSLRKLFIRSSIHTSVLYRLHFHARTHEEALSGVCCSLEMLTMSITDVVQPLFTLKMRA